MRLSHFANVSAMTHLRLWESELMLAAVIKRDFALIISSLSVSLDSHLTMKGRNICLSLSREPLIRSTSHLADILLGSPGCAVLTGKQHSVQEQRRRFRGLRTESSSHVMLLPPCYSRSNLCIQISVSNLKSTL